MDVDAIVIGSGQAGVPFAARWAHHGRTVMLVERAELGGTCTNYGCTPTKTMVASAEAAHLMRRADRLGVHAGEVRVDLGEVVARKDAIVKRWREGAERTLRDAGPKLQLVRGAARFVDERTIEVNGQRHRGEMVLINVGCRPLIPSVPGLDQVPILDNRTVMQLRELPAELLIMGGGYIGCELGQLYRRLGAAVSIVHRGRHLLPREDPDVSAALEAVFRGEGIDLHLGSEVRDVTRAGDEIVVRFDGAEVRGSHLLVATGRRPNTDDLGCDAAGVKLDKNGFITVDDLYRTSARGIYAVGDCAGQPQFTHTAWDDHRILFDILINGSKRGRGDRLVPYTVFTDPQVAGVGLTESEARKRGISFEVATLPFGRVARAIETDQPAGLIKVLIDPKTERILGANVVGAQAGELIHVFVALMQAGASARAIVDAEFVHPTFAEGLQTTVMSLKRYMLS